MKKFLLVEKSGDMLFFCPGCDRLHLYVLDGTRGWRWDGNKEEPTVTPSLLNRAPSGSGIPEVCHMFLTKGKLVYLADCTHNLAGKIIDMVESDLL